MTTVRCLRGESFSLGKQEIAFEDFACSRFVRGAVEDTHEKCSQKGTVLRIGFNARKKWLNLITVCYDYSSGIPLYSEHILRGQANRESLLRFTRVRLLKWGFNLNLIGRSE